MLKRWKCQGLGPSQLIQDQADGVTYSEGWRWLQEKCKKGQTGMNLPRLAAGLTSQYSPWSHFRMKERKTLRCCFSKCPSIDDLVAKLQHQSSQRHSFMPWSRLTLSRMNIHFWSQPPCKSDCSVTLVRKPKLAQKRYPVESDDQPKLLQPSQPRCQTWKWRSYLGILAPGDMCGGITEETNCNPKSGLRCMAAVKPARPSMVIWAIPAT